jgi:Na+-transporting methylmalonyl-CoA/oxaloacetate decarboxylase gamma subunit
MVLRYYTNAISSASRGFAKWLFVVALLLIGFGVLILTFPEVFAFLAALVFFITGLGVAGTAVKIYLAQRRFDKMTRPDSQDYRQNVKIHTPYSEEHYDI